MARTTRKRELRELEESERLSKLSQWDAGLTSRSSRRPSNQISVFSLHPTTRPISYYTKRSFGLENVVGSSVPGK